MKSIDNIPIEDMNFKKISIFDSHVHFGSCKDINDTVQRYREMMEYYDYSKIAIAALVYEGFPPKTCADQNYKALLLKNMLGPKVYAYGGIVHEESESCKSILNQAKELVRLGVDGFKTLEGKPTIRRYTGIPLDDKIYDKFFEYMETEKIPYLIHVGDIEILWHPENLPLDFINIGYYYDKTYKTNKELFVEAEGILKKFPNLHIIFAHFMFRADDLDYCVHLMESYPNVCLDLTPHPAMFEEFGTRLDDWKLFFDKYFHRILYGSDNYDVPISETVSMNKLVRSFLEKKNKEYMWHNIIFYKPEMIVKTLGLKDKQLKSIYMENAERMLGKTPKAIDSEMLANKYKVKKMIVGGEKK